jgi:hypothetical protein
VDEQQYVFRDVLSRNVALVSVLERAAASELPGWSFNMVLRPNPVLAPPEVYREKANRWVRRWPQLRVIDTGPRGDVLMRQNGGGSSFGSFVAVSVALVSVALVSGQGRGRRAARLARSGVVNVSPVIRLK